MTNLKAVACSIMLIALMFTAYMFLQNYVYPRTIGRPFGGMIFFGIFSGVFTMVIAIAYILLKLVLEPTSAYA